MSQLNEKVIAALPVPAKGNKIYPFGGIALQGVTAPDGFGVRVTSNGVRSFVLGYSHGRQKRCDA